LLDRETASVALVVSDDWQHRGIGARLLAMLLDAARARGIRRMEGETLAENATALALMHKLGFASRRDPDSPDIQIVEREL
jgi:acetyltransferase